MGPHVAANAERWETTKAPQCMLGFRWCRHWKDPTCVVGEQRQFFHLALVCQSLLVMLVTQVN